MFLNIFKHLLPRANAWKLTAEKKLRQFFEGLAGTGDDVKLYLDNIWYDLFPETTRELDLMDQQFGLKFIGLNDQERRVRIAAAWKALGDQDPSYIQTILQSNGFDVYVHEWWEPGSEPVPGVATAGTARNPLLWLRSTLQITYTAECNEPLAECGEPDAECGNTSDPIGYPLVNKIYITTLNYLIECNEPLAECGEPLAECGEYDGFIESLLLYEIPADPIYWPYFLYIGGEVFGTKSPVDSKRKNEFETLCLKICPTQQWLGLLIDYN